MINIISKSLILNTVTGPGKVVRNLIAGLEKIGYPYVVNQSLDSCKRLYIHDDVEALRDTEKVSDNIKVIVGPNLYIWPRHVPTNIDLSRFVYIHPSKWAMDSWKHFGYNRSEIDFWPAGIDTDSFNSSSVEERKTVLIYIKHRSEDDLEYCIKRLQQNNIEYRIIRYGAYTETEYRDFLKQTRYIIWIGTSESQGIGLLEALASDIPVLVWDIENFGHAENVKNSGYYLKDEKKYTGCTTAPYFDNSCGVIMKDKSMLDFYIQEMEQCYQQFTPRMYILENLNLQKQAREFVELYDKYFDLSREEGLVEKRFKQGRYKNSMWYYVSFFALKSKLKFIKKLIKSDPQ